MSDLIWHHGEEIVCPKCSSIERAIVQHTRPFWTYMHDCQKCGYTIMESEWAKAPDPTLKIGQRVWVKSEMAAGEVKAFIGHQVSVKLDEGIGAKMFDWDDLRWSELGNV